MSDYLIETPKGSERVNIWRKNHYGYYNFVQYLEIKDLKQWTNAHKRDTIISKEIT